MANGNQNPNGIVQWKPIETKTPMELANGNKNPNVIGQWKSNPQFNHKKLII